MTKTNTQTQQQKEVKNTMEQYKNRRIFLNLLLESKTYLVYKKSNLFTGYLAI